MPSSTFHKRFVALCHPLLFTKDLLLYAILYFSQNQNTIQTHSLLITWV